jgi:hypothetical protein
MNGLFFLLFFVVLAVVTVRGLVRAVKRASSAAAKEHGARVIVAGKSVAGGPLDAPTLKTLEALATAKLAEVRAPDFTPPPRVAAAAGRVVEAERVRETVALPVDLPTNGPRRNEHVPRTAASIARDLRESRLRDHRIAAVPVRTPDERATDSAALARTLTTAVERTLATAEHGPRLSISSSLVRPLATLYSAVVRVGAADESAARRALATVASESRFFGLGLADARELDEAHLVAASTCLRRADASLRAAVEHDLGVLELTLDGAATTEIAALRRLVG